MSAIHLVRKPPSTQLTNPDAKLHNANANANANNTNSHLTPTFLHSDEFCPATTNNGGAQKAKLYCEKRREQQEINSEISQEDEFDLRGRGAASASATLHGPVE